VYKRQALAALDEKFLSQAQVNGLQGNVAARAKAVGARLFDGEAMDHRQVDVLAGPAIFTRQQRARQHGAAIPAIGHGVYSLSSILYGEWGKCKWIPLPYNMGRGSMFDVRRSKFDVEKHC
jgi:hypothetical protein